MSKYLSRLFLCLFAITAFVETAGAAVPLATAEASHSTLRVYAERDGLKADIFQWLAVEIEPQEGWHSYWKNPGDSGASPILDWNLPQGLSAGEPLYAVPDLIPVGPLANYGYHGTSVLLVKLDAGANIARTPLLLDAEWLICEIECVPQFASLTINPGEGEGVKIAENAGLFSTARSKLPEPSFWSARLDVGTGISKLTVLMDKADIKGLENARFFAGDDGIVTYAAPQEWRWAEEGLVISMIREDGAQPPEKAEGLLVIETTDGVRTGYELAAKLTVAAPAEGSSPSGTGYQIPSMPLWQAGLFALLGGLILNLMPCVFPVLSLKAFAFLSANYKTKANRQHEGLAYTLGIWVSFMAIVGVLVALRAGGAAIGWGFQLQEPLFVALMMVLMVFVALSLSGFFELRLGVEGAGQNFAAREGIQGAFFKGVLAALVATPCTAPLMAPAIGFALTQPLLTVFIVFSLLAIGLALPFLALSFIPAVARIMPRPGAWMEKMKEGLAFPMYLTAAWLLYIFDRQLGAVATLLLLAGLITAIFGLWLFKQGQGKWLRGFATLFLIGGLLFIASKPWGDLSSEAGKVAGDHEVYSDTRVSQLRAEGKPVFVYFTADWCITCKVNERMVLTTDDIEKAFADGGVHVLKGDWTNRNSEIAEVLARYGRVGVPLYLYFAPGATEAVVLPEILTKSAVTTAINEE